jgi:hypothetical protein
LHRFYNTPSDTSFLYFNAVNFYLQHYIFFKYFTAGIGGSHSSNNDFELNVLEESLVINMPKNSSLGGGVKINSYNKGPSELGYWFRMGCRFMKTGSIQAQYDDGLIPGSNKQLISNKWFTLSITKIF